MTKVNIEGVEYDFDALSDNAKAQAASLQFLEEHMKLLKDDIAVLSTARNAYMDALRAELARM